MIDRCFRANADEPRFDPKRHCGLLRGGGIDGRWWGREAILDLDFTISHRCNNAIFARNDLVYECLLSVGYISR